MSQAAKDIMLPLNEKFDLLSELLALRGELFELMSPRDRKELHSLSARGTREAMRELSILQHGADARIEWFNVWKARAWAEIQMSPAPIIRMFLIVMVNVFFLVIWLAVTKNMHTSFQRGRVLPFPLFVRQIFQEVVASRLFVGLMYFVAVSFNEISDVIKLPALRIIFIGMYAVLLRWFINKVIEKVALTYSGVLDLPKKYRYHLVLIRSYCVNIFIIWWYCVF